jgi:hypothetical protein
LLSSLSHLLLLDVAQAPSADRLRVCGVPAFSMIVEVMTAT